MFSQSQLIQADGTGSFASPVSFGDDGTTVPCLARQSVAEVSLKGLLRSPSVAPKRYRKHKETVEGGRGFQGSEMNSEHNLSAFLYERPVQKAALEHPNPEMGCQSNFYRSPERLLQGLLSLPNYWKLVPCIGK